ncbi:hypothetical protein LCGC14_0174660 [marine sediment metagenome]|uniref:Uncharacterized protein n=1 Tax=marine sediment metagenome TaxID=412755 RepID=A0A0F9V7A2_9ZZZZ
MSIEKPTPNTSKWLGMNHNKIDKKLFPSLNKETVTSIILLNYGGKGSRKPVLGNHIIKNAIEIYGENNVEIISSPRFYNIIGTWNPKTKSFDNSRIKADKSVHIINIPQSESLFDRNYTNREATVKLEETLQRLRFLKNTFGLFIFIFNSRSLLVNILHRYTDLVFYIGYPRLFNRNFISDNLFFSNKQFPEEAEAIMRETTFQLDKGDLYERYEHHNYVVDVRFGKFASYRPEPTHINYLQKALEERI